MATIRLFLNRKSTQIVNHLIRRNLMICCQQNLRSKPICFRFINKSLNNSLQLFKLNKLSQKCLFYTSPKRYNPLIVIVLRQAAKFAAVLTGRAVRKWWRDLPPNKRQLVVNWFLRHKWRFGLGLSSLLILFYVYYLSHIEETPITRRKRFIAFTPNQLKDLNNYEFEVQLEMYKNKLLPSSHPSSKQVARVATQLLNGNNDLEQIHDNEWSISVIEDNNVKNAFVLPSGQIFVFTGIFGLCDNDMSLGVVLAHEMAHSILGHGSELVSHSHLIDLMFICIIGLIWAVLPSDITASISTGISRFIMSIISDQPYSRMLETEADIVGLELAAKACFDVREASAFWHKMSIIENSDGIQFASDDIKIPIKPEFLSTHPSHEKRFHYLDTLMDDAIKLRNKCNCPKLPAYDPRLNVEILKKSIEDHHKNQRKEGVIVLPKPPVPPHLQQKS